MQIYPSIHPSLHLCKACCTFDQEMYEIKNSEQKRQKLMLLTYGPGYPTSPFCPGVPMFPETPWRHSQRAQFTLKDDHQFIL